MKNLILLLGVVLASSASAQGMVVTILVSNFTFTPQNATAHVGDTVRWTWSVGEHTTTSGVIPVGAASWDTLINVVQTTYSYVPSVPGVYNYFCTYHASAGMTGTINVQPLDVAVQQKPAIRISPNPANERLEVSIPDLSTKTAVQLLDMQGRIISEGFIEPGNTLVIHTGGFPSGWYLVRYQTGEIRLTERITIKH